MLYHFNYLDDMFKLVALALSRSYRTTGAMFETWEISVHGKRRDVRQLLQNHLVDN